MDETREKLGEVTAPSGVVLLLDTGLLGFLGEFEPPSIRCTDPEAAQKEALGTALVELAQLIFVDAEALAGWKHTEALDGKADFVFWGSDAEQLASEVKAPALAGEEDVWGWLDLPVDEAMERGRKAELLMEERELKLATDLRPHSHHYQVLEQMRSTPTVSGTLKVGRATVCAFHTTWESGVFPVERHIDARGRVARVRVLLAPR